MKQQHTKERAVVIGARGPIGSALLRRLIENKADVSAVTRDRSFRASGAKVLCGDLSDARFARRALKGAGTVFYTASMRKNLERHIREPWKFARGNVAPLLSVLTALSGSKVKRFLYMSSIQVSYAADEDSRIDGYAFGKSINEMLVRAFAEEHPDIDVKIIRATAVYGPGDSFDPQDANLIPSFIRKAATARARMDMWGKGTRKMQFIYIDDVIDNLLAIAQDHRRKFFILGNPAAYSINQLAVMVMSAFGKKLVITHDLSKPDKPTKLFKFRNKVNPKVSLVQGIKKTVRWYREHYA